MAINNKIILNDYNLLQNYNSTGKTVWGKALTALKDAFNWHSNTNITNSNSQDCPSDYVGSFYFDENIYLKIYTSNVNGNSVRFNIGIFNNNSCIYWIENQTNYYDVVNISVTTINSTTCFRFTSSRRTTSKLIDDIYNFCLYYGSYTNVQGSVEKGIVIGDLYTNSFFCIDNNGTVGPTETFISNINNNKKAVYIPVVNSATGDVFNNIYFMRYSPCTLSYIELDDKTHYLCSRNMCVLDD